MKDHFYIRIATFQIQVRGAARVMGWMEVAKVEMSVSAQGDGWGRGQLSRFSSTEKSQSEPALALELEDPGAAQ